MRTSLAVGNEFPIAPVVATGIFSSKEDQKNK